MKKYFIRALYYTTHRAIECDIVQASDVWEADAKMGNVPANAVAIWDCRNTYNDAWAQCNRLVVQFNNR